LKDHFFNKIDILIVPIVLLVIGLTVYVIKKKENKNLLTFFFYGISLRAFGTVLMALIMEFYYNYGDTYNYYYNVQALRSLFIKEPITWLKVIFSDPQGGGESMSRYINIIENYNINAAAVFKTAENANLCKIASVFNIVCFDSYLGLALIFGLLSFLGCWYIFKTFVNVFPGYEKKFALLCLYLPSLWFWGTGVVKDSLCLFALGILFYNFFIKQKSNRKRLILVCLGTYILLVVKSYILFAFIIAAIIAFIIFLFNKSSRTIKIFFCLIIIGILLALNNTFSDIFNGILNNSITNSQRFLELYTQTSEFGDASIIPSLDPTPIGFFKFIIEGLVTVFFKPFPWQISKPIYLFVIIENLLIYYIVFTKIKLTNINFGNKSKLLIYFCFAFFLLLGSIIGISAFNFGTISRYRIPALPFFFSGIFCLKLYLSVKKNKANLV
jgi:hypothetical protein